MKPFSNDTIILLFSRFAEEEAKEKKYASILGKKRGTALASELIRHTLKEARDTALPVMPFFSDQQKGNTFAERLTDAIERTFALGYNNIIISGTDSPSVNSKQLEKVAEKLQATQLVLAPSNDGGVYLIGINIDAYSKRSILNIPWLTNSVFESLKTYANHHHFSLFIETVGEDLDCVTDVLQLQSSCHNHWLSLLITQLINTYKKTKHSLLQLHLFTTLLFSISSLRGPPQFHL